MYKFIFIFLFLLPLTVAAQETDSVFVEPHYDLITELQQYSHSGGEVKIQSDSHVADLLQWHIHQNEHNKTFSGYRIQIYSVGSYGSNIEKLKEMRDKFEETFPDIPAYLKYLDPDFKIRVGNYRSRLECIPDLYRIRKLYPSSYPVKTEISLEELKRVPKQPETEVQE